MFDRGGMCEEGGEIEKREDGSDFCVDFVVMLILKPEFIENCLQLFFSPNQFFMEFDE